MEFGSSHVYAGTPDENPYYSPVAFEGNSESSNHSKNGQNESLYESVQEMYQTTSPPPNSPFYDPVYIDSESQARKPEYDEVAFEGPERPTKPQYDEVCFERPLPAPTPVTSPKPPLPSKPHPPKKSLSASVIHKANKVINKLHKSSSSAADVNSPPPLPRAKTITDKPLPPIPQSNEPQPPELPPPRLLPKPKQYQTPSVKRSQSTPTTISHVPGGMSTNAALIDEMFSSNSESNFKTTSKPESVPMTPTLVPASRLKPLYPILPNQYESSVDVHKSVASSIATAPPPSQMVKSADDFDLISFDDPLPAKPLPVRTNPPRTAPTAPHLSSSMVKRETRGNKPKNIYSTADTNVVSVKLGILENAGESMPWALPPFRCEKCEGVLLHNALAEDKNASFCRFCHHQNSKVAEEVLPLVRKESDVTFIVDQEPAITNEDSLVVFCIDTSGSMCVTSEVQSPNNTCFMSRLQGVKEGILNQLRNLKLTRPKVRAAVVTFSNMVTLLGDGSPDQYIALTDAHLFDTDYIKAIGSSAILPNSLEHSFATLSNTVNMLKEHGGTALGPALLLSVALASRKPGSQVIVCTDGRANVGIGSLETESDYKMCHNFYKETSDYAAEMGIMVSILSIEGSDCRLVELGKVSNKSAGKVKIVNTSNFADEFSDIISNSLMATNVSVSIVSQKELYFNDADKKCKSLVKNFVGNAKRDTEITFKYGLDCEQKTETPPKIALFQLQVQYKLTNGCTYLRVITQLRPVTENQLVAEEGLNPTVIGTYASQLASKLVLDGDLLDARVAADAHKKLISRAQSIRSTYSSVSGNQERTDDTRIYGSVCYEMDEIKKVTESVLPKANVVPNKVGAPPLPPRQYEDIQKPKATVSRTSSTASRTSSISSLSLPDVPDSPLMRREKIIEAVENCPDEVASKLYKYRNASQNMFTAM